MPFGSSGSLGSGFSKSSGSRKGGARCPVAGQPRSRRVPELITRTMRTVPSVSDHPRRHVEWSVLARFGVPASLGPMGVNDGIAQREALRRFWIRPKSCGGSWAGHSTGRWAWTPPPPVRRDSGGGVAPVVVPRLRDRSTRCAVAPDRRREGGGVHGRGGSEGPVAALRVCRHGRLPPPSLCRATAAGAPSPDTPTAGEPRPGASTALLLLCYSAPCRLG